MPKFLVIDTHAIYDGNHFDDSRQVYNSRDEMVKALTEEGQGLISEGNFNYFEDWQRGLEIYEIASELPRPTIEATVSVSFPELIQPESEPEKATLIDLVEARRQRERLTGGHGIPAFLS